MYHTLQAYRSTDLEAFKEALSTTAEELGGSFSTDQVSENSEFKLLVAATPTTITIHYPQPIAYFTAGLGRTLGVPMMEVRLQDSSHWDYCLYLGDKHVDSFSTLPQYWDDDEEYCRAKLGDAKKLSAAFGVPIEDIERYLRNWYPNWDKETGEHWDCLQGKAYPDDQSDYGNYDQFWDFLPRIGIQDPCAVEAETLVWELKLPDRRRDRARSRPLPWWRRLF